MTIIGYILGTVLSYWSWIAFAAIVAMTIKWYLLSAKKEVVDPFLGVPEIKPHWFWGNLGSIFGEDHFVVYYMKHYTVLSWSYLLVFIRNDITTIYFRVLIVLKVI